MSRKKDSEIIGAIITKALSNAVKNTALTCPYCHDFIKPITTVTRCGKCGRQIFVKISEGG